VLASIEKSRFAATAPARSIRHRIFAKSASPDADQFQAMRAPRTATQSTKSQIEKIVRWFVEPVDAKSAPPHGLCDSAVDVSRKIRPVVSNARWRVDSPPQLAGRSSYGAAAARILIAVAFRIFRSGAAPREMSPLR